MFISEYLQIAIIISNIVIYELSLFVIITYLIIYKLVVYHEIY